MLGLIAPILVALAAAVALGRSPRQLLEHSLRGWPALVVAFAVELTLYNPPVNTQAWAMQVGPGLWIGCRLVILAVLVANGWRHDSDLVWPWRLASVGVGLNTLVVCLNGGHMPQSIDAALAVWGTSHIDPTRLQNVVPMGPDTRLAWLGDTLAEPAWLPRPNVVSLGDVLLAIGVAAWIFSATTNTRVSGANIGPSATPLCNGAAGRKRSSSS